MKRASESASEAHAAPRVRSLCIAMCGMLAAASALAIAGCGQRGPLYLPQRTGTVVTRPTAPASPQGPPAADPAAGPSQHSSSSSSSSSTAPGK